MITHNDPARLGVGFYSIPEVARLLRVPLQTVRRWVDPEEQLIQRVSIR